MTTPEKQHDQLTALLRELMAEVQEVKADVAFLKVHLLADKAAVPKQAVIQLPFTYELGEPSIALTVDEWALVRRGETLIKERAQEVQDDDLYCWERWEIYGGKQGRVKLFVAVEQDGDYECEQDELLVDCTIREENAS